MTTTDKNGWSGAIKGQPGIGDTAERSRTTSMADVERFTAMTGDKNPIHYDEAIAKATPLGTLVVQGGVTTGLLNAVVAKDLPGPGTVFLETNWRFSRAVKVGEEIMASVKVTEVREDKPICKLETEVRNADGDICVQGTAVTYTLPCKM
ncbi:MAG: MaoC family dehydratase [Pseudomonadota bacterium]